MSSNEFNKNIWIINQFAGTPENGWGERHYFLSKTWIEFGYNVTIISGSFNHVFSYLPETNGQYTVENHSGRRFCWVKTPKYSGQSRMRFWSMMVFALKILWVPVKKLGRPDIIIVSSMPIFTVLPVVLFKKIYKVKFIFEIRDLWPLSLVYLQNLSKNHPAVKFIGWFERMGYKRADAIVSLLPAADSYINRISGDPAKFNWIPNGLDENCLEIQDPHDYNLAQIPNNKFIIGYAGALNMANAMSYFIDAARLLKDYSSISFVLVGDGYQKKELESKARELTNVVFLPRVKKSQVLNIIRKFTVCYIGWRNLPLYNYGVSANKYSDYMLCSKPILDSNNYVKDPVELSGCGVIVKPESAEAIANGVLELYQKNAEELNKLGDLGYKYVNKYHNIRFLALKYIKLFE